MELDPPSPGPLTLTPGPARPPPIQVLAAFRLLFGTAHCGRSLAFASALLLIPLAGPIIIMGWLVEIQHRLSKRHPTPVPALSWRDLPQHLRRGWPVSLVLTLGSLLGGVLGYLLFILSNLLAVGLGLSSGNWDTSLLVFVLGLLGTLLLGAVTSVWLISGLTQVVRQGHAGAAWNAATRAYAWANAGRILWIALRFLPLAGLLLVLAAATCGLGLLPALVLLGLAAMHLCWQLAEHHQAQQPTSPSLQPKAPALTLLPSERHRVALLPEPRVLAPGYLEQEHPAAPHKTELHR